MPTGIVHEDLPLIGTGQLKWIGSLRGLRVLAAAQTGVTKATVRELIPSGERRKAIVDRLVQARLIQEVGPRPAMYLANVRLPDIADGSVASWLETDGITWAWLGVEIAAALNCQARSVAELGRILGMTEDSVRPFFPALLKAQRIRHELPLFDLEPEYPPEPDYVESHSDPPDPPYPQETPEFGTHSDPLNPGTGPEPYEVGVRDPVPRDSSNRTHSTGKSPGFGTRSQPPDLPGAWNMVTVWEGDRITTVSRKRLAELKRDPDWRRGQVEAERRAEKRHRESMRRRALEMQPIKPANGGNQ